jgi:hypothetical protein
MLHIQQGKGLTEMVRVSLLDAVFVRVPQLNAVGCASKMGSASASVENGGLSGLERRMVGAVDFANDNVLLQRKVWVHDVFYILVHETAAHQVNQQ